MSRNILLGLIFLFLLSCTSEKMDKFVYQQNFSPKPEEIISQADRLVFQDVREEGRLSSWNKANWSLKDTAVAVVGSRTAEWQRREESVRDVYQGNESFVTLRGYRVPWLTLSMGDRDWIDYVIETTVPLEKGTSAGVAFRYQNSRQYYAFMLMNGNKASLLLRLQDREATPEHEAWTPVVEIPFKIVEGHSYRMKVKT